MQLYHHHDLPTSHQLWTGHSSSEIGFFSFRSVDLGGFRDLEIEIVSKETFLRKQHGKKGFCKGSSCAQHMQKVIINARDSDAPLALEKYPEEISGDSCIT